MNQGKKKKWILLLVGGVIAILVIAVVVIGKKNETYRLIKVESFEGNVSLQRDAIEEKIF